MPLRPLPPVDKTFDVDRLTEIADRAGGTLAGLRDALLEPWPRKQSPIITGSRLAQLLGMNSDQLTYRIKRGEIASGVAKGNGRHREYSLEEAQEQVRKAGPYARRPAGAPAVTIAVGNFKGGVGKTTIAVAIAQGMTLHGKRVLLIDLDPQASSTTLMGFVPDAEVDEEATIMPVVYGEQASLEYAIQSTYWANLDFIPSSPALFGADFFLPNKQANNPEFAFWRIIDDAMATARQNYDVIVIDTPPTLSYLAIASFFAADGVVVPLPPETLDYASSTQFFRQFAELWRTMKDKRSVPKNFQFIKLVLSKVKEASTTHAVRSWIHETYPELLTKSEVLESDVVKNASAVFKTIYDLGTAYQGSIKTLMRAVEAFDGLVNELDGDLATVWARYEQQEAA